VVVDGIEWKCTEGFCGESMKMLNDEFNYFRGLFPLKVFLSGPPCSGKTYFASKLSEQYGIPHITIKDIIAMGNSLTNEFGQKLKQKVEELKDQAEAEYEKSRKKKDPDFDKANYHPRLTEDILTDLVKIQLNSAAC
jgi:dephospho-CoA kinase